MSWRDVIGADMALGHFRPTTGVHPSAPRVMTIWCMDGSSYAVEPNPSDGGNHVHCPRGHVPLMRHLPCEEWESGAVVYKNVPTATVMVLLDQHGGIDLFRTFAWKAPG